MPIDRVLVNARSGSGVGKKILDHLASCSASGGFETFPMSTGADSPALTGISSVSRLYIAGGDGSLHSLLPHLRQFTGVIGLLPLGTCNDLGRFLSIRRCTVASSLLLMERLRAAKPLELQVWSFQAGSQQAYFINYASWGFDAQILHAVESWRHSRRSVKRWQTLLEYAKRSFLGLLREQRFYLSTNRTGNQERQRLTSCLCANIPTVMGFGRSNRLSNPSDSLIEVLLLPNPWEFSMMLALQRALATPIQVPDIEFRLENNSKELLLQLDGEPYRFEPSATMSIKPAFKLNFFCLNRQSKQCLRENNAGIEN